MFNICISLVLGVTIIGLAIACDLTGVSVVAIQLCLSKYLEFWIIINVRFPILLGLGIIMPRSRIDWNGRWYEECNFGYSQ